LLQCYTAEKNLQSERGKQMQLAWKVGEGSKVRLKDYDPGFVDKHTDHILAATETESLSGELGELQKLLGAAQHHSLLILLQGMDTSGKDGTIRHVMTQLNPLGCEVHSFKAPTEAELARDFLWRCHNVVPGRGTICIFNRSYYEDVLVVRVHDLVPETVWRHRYKAINNFERLLSQNGTIMLKFYLHISYEEQAERLQAREEERTKAWKLSAADWSERPYWNDYQKAYETALSRCSTEQAPWYIVPANHKWYRNLLVARTLVATLRPYRKEWQAELVKRGEQELERIAKLQLGSVDAD
jgi:PPK2 family polyphosphate:nucleotide phosphotransferase